MTKDSLFLFILKSSQNVIFIDYEYYDLMHIVEQLASYINSKNDGIEFRQALT